MKITKSQLRELIREVINESFSNADKPLPADNRYYFKPAKERVYAYVRNGQEGDLDFSDLKQVPEGLSLLTHVKGNLSIVGTKIKELPNLRKVDGNFFAHSSKLEKLPNGLVVGGDFSILNTPLSKKLSVDDIKKKVKARSYTIVKGD